MIIPNLSDQQRRDAYDADITYGTNNEFGFDYLRDNMKYERSSMVQRPFNMAIVDEVDLDPDRRGAHPADHLRPDRRQVRLYMSVDAVVKQLTAEDYEKDEKQKSIILTEDGTEKVERMLEAAGLLEGANLVRLREHPGRPSHQPGAARQHDVQAATSIISSRTARSSSSMSSPAA